MGLKVLVLTVLWVLTVLVLEVLRVLTVLVLEVLRVLTVLVLEVLGVRTLLVLEVLRVLTVLVPRVPRVPRAPTVLLMVGLLVAAVEGTAGAQEVSRGYVAASVGSARAVETDSAYAGLGAWRLNACVHVFGEIGRLRNAIGSDLRDRLADLEADIRAANSRQFGTGFPVVFEPRVPAWYGLGGLRVHGPSAGRLSTYVEAGAGSARLDPQVHLAINGENLDSEAAAVTGLGDGRQQLAFLAAGGGGVAFRAAKHVRIEAGYRYMRLFGDAKTNINRVHAGGGWAF